LKISILTNGPGELWDWVRPVSVELRKRGHSISLWLLSCPYASGSERQVASGLGVDKLEGPLDGIHMWNALGQEKTDCVLQLGGDLIFGRHLAKRAAAPLFCYAYAPKKGMEHARCFTAWPKMALQMPKARVIGDLVRDALALDTGTLSWGQRESRRLLLFPGSRPAIRQMALPWMALLAGQVKLALPDVEIGTLFSPFVHDEELPLWREAGLNPIQIGAGVAMRSADYALTQPGTNTLEMMHCGLPALIAAPDQFLEAVPLGGLRGMLASLPLMGSAIRRRGLERLLDRYEGFMSWPNRLAGRMVMDEMKGDLSPQKLADRVVSALKDEGRRARAREELLALSGPAGAAFRLAEAMEAAV
jgi:lipid-A-disaccharide synthase